MRPKGRIAEQTCVNTKPVNY